METKYFKLTCDAVTDDGKGNPKHAETKTILVESKDLETCENESSRFLNSIYDFIQIEEITQDEYEEVYPPLYPCMGCGSIYCCSQDGSCVM